MRKLVGAVVVAVILAGCDPQPVFKSGFEGVQMGEPYEAPGAQWAQQIVGTDVVSGFTWPDDLPGESDGNRPLVSVTSSLSDYTQLYVTSFLGSDGEPTNALLSIILGDDPTFQALSRNNMILRPAPSTLHEYYLAWDLWLQPNLLELASEGGDFFWLGEAEVKHHVDPAGERFRAGLAICWTQTNGLHWRMESENGVASHNWVYRKIDTGVAVKLGEWMRIEWYLKQHPTGGRWIISIDGNVLGDHSGQTMVEGLYVDKLNLTKHYLDSSEVSSTNPAYQYIDNLELWADADALEQLD